MNFVGAISFISYLDAIVEWNSPDLILRKIKDGEFRLVS